MVLHVTNVSDSTSDTHVFQTFSEYGKIIWLRKVEFVSMGTRSYLIAFRDEKDGEKAMREMNGMRVKGNHWKITRTQLSESHLSSKAIQTPSYCFGTVSSDCPRDITRIERNFNTTEYLRIQERAGYGTYGKNVALLPIPVHSSIAIAEWFVAGPLNCLPQRQVETFSSSPPNGANRNSAKCGHCVKKEIGFSQLPTSVNESAKTISILSTLNW